MFYDVKVLDPQGRIKKIIPSQELSRLHWKAFNFNEEIKDLPTSKRPKVSRWVKKNGYGIQGGRITPPGRNG